MTIRFFIYALIMTALFIGCGGNKAESDAAGTAAEQQADTGTQAAEEHIDAMIAHRPGSEPIDLNQGIMNRGPELEPDELTPGTCEYTAYWFAEYFTIGDSLNAYTLCTDSMEIIVRTILQKEGQIDNMMRNRQAGYKLESISLVNDDYEDFCQACITASFMDETRDDCNFRFVKINGEWLLNGFGE